MNDLGRVGDVAAGGQSALELNVLRGLRDGGRSQGNGDRLQGGGLHLIVCIDAEAEQFVAGRSDQFVLGIGLKLAVAGVERLAAGPLDDEKAVPLNGQVRGVRADLNRALREVGGDFGDLGAQPDLLRVGAAEIALRAGTQALRLQELRGEDGRRTLEADRAGVRQIIAHDVDRGLRGAHSGQGGAESGCQAHSLVP